MISRFFYGLAFMELTFAIVDFGAAHGWDFRTPDWRWPELAFACLSLVASFATRKDSKP